MLEDFDHDYIKLQINIGHENMIKINDCNFVLVKSEQQIAPQQKTIHENNDHTIETPPAIIRYWSRSMI